MAKTKENPQKLFGQNLRKLRKAKGWSQEQFADKVQLDRTYVGSVERGERNISLVNITRISETLGISASELLDFK